MLIAPTPSSPSRRQVISTLTPTLIWSEGSNFSSLQINIRKWPFGPADGVYTSAWLLAGATSVTVSAPLTEGTDYRWDVTACSGTNGTGTCITGSIATFSTPNPPAYRTDGDPFGTIVRSLRTADFNVKVTRDESWLWRRRPGVAYLHMNGAAVVALRALYRMSQELLEGAEAQRLKREILARGPRNTQVNTKYMQAEIDFWKVLAGMHGMPAGRVLMWAFALIDLEQGRAT